MFRLCSAMTLALGAALLLAAGAAWASPLDDERAAGEPPWGAEVSAVVTGSVPITGEQKIAAALARTFGVTVAQVMSVRQQLGWGEVYKVFVLAKLSGKSASEIVAMRQTQGGWGEVYSALGQRPGKGQNLGQALKASPPPQAKPPQQPSPPAKGRDKKTK